MKKLILGLLLSTMLCVTACGNDTTTDKNTTDKGVVGDTGEALEDGAEELEMMSETEQRAWEIRLNEIWTMPQEAKIHQRTVMQWEPETETQQDRKKESVFQQALFLYVQSIQNIIIL